MERMELRTFTTGILQECCFVANIKYYRLFLWRTGYSGLPCAFSSFVRIFEEPWTRRGSYPLRTCPMYQGWRWYASQRSLWKIGRFIKVIYYGQINKVIEVSVLGSSGSASQSQSRRTARPTHIHDMRPSMNRSCSGDHLHITPFSFRSSRFHFVFVDRYACHASFDGDHLNPLFLSAVLVS